MACQRVHHVHTRALDRIPAWLYSTTLIFSANKKTTTQHIDQRSLVAPLDKRSRAPSLAVRVENSSTAADWYISRSNIIAQRVRQVLISSFAMTTRCAMQHRINEF